MAQIKNLNILNSKDRKPIMKYLQEHFGFEKDLDFVFVMNNKDKVHMINKEFETVLDKRLRIDKIGMYFGEMRDNAFRLSMDASQMIGHDCTKNIINISDEQARQWIMGLNIDVESTDCDGFVIVKHNNDFMGCGSFSNGTVYNYISKTRRLKEVN